MELANADGAVMLKSGEQGVAEGVQVWPQFAVEAMCMVGDSPRLLKFIDSSAMSVASISDRPCAR